jgi:hypothetical protein
MRTKLMFLKFDGGAELIIKNKEEVLKVIHFSNYFNYEESLKSVSFST